MLTGKVTCKDSPLTYRCELWRAHPAARGGNGLSMSSHSISLAYALTAWDCVVLASVTANCAIDTVAEMARGQRIENDWRGASTPYE